MALELDKPPLESICVATSWMFDSGQVLILVNLKLHPVFWKQLFTLLCAMPWAKCWGCGTNKVGLLLQRRKNKLTFYNTHVGIRDNKLEVETNCHVAPPGLPKGIPLAFNLTPGLLKKETATLEGFPTSWYVIIFPRCNLGCSYFVLPVKQTCKPCWSITPKQT